MTQTGMSLGTPQYMAPEQAMGEKTVDARADVYALGCVLYEMLTGEPPFTGPSAQAIVARVMTEQPVAPAARRATIPSHVEDAVLTAIEKLPAEKREAIEKAITATYDSGPGLAMVDSDRGITNLHVPSDVIVDASMPAAIRSSGQMWNAKGELQDTKFVIPDSSYAALYAETVAFCREKGAFDPTTMGTVPNVGLMAQKAE